MPEIRVNNVTLFCEEMGVITPPVGVNVFVIKGIASDIPLQTIFKEIFPFLVALIILTIIPFALNIFSVLSK